MASSFQVDVDTFRSLWSRKRLQYDRGDLSLETYWLDLAEATHRKLSAEQIQQLSAWDVEMWGHINPIMLEWLKRLRSSGLKAGLLSNMPLDMIFHMRERMAWLDQFNHLTFSAEVKLVKPDPAIYQHSLNALGVTASETIFVDDKEVNIQSARALGISAIRFQSVTQLARDLKALAFGILPDGSKPF
jgi:putative hydrolase of the HAD superfamily